MSDQRDPELLGRRLAVLRRVYPTLPAHELAEMLEPGRLPPLVELLEQHPKPAAAP